MLERFYQLYEVQFDKYYNKLKNFITTNEGKNCEEMAILSVFFSQNTKKLTFKMSQRHLN